MISFKSPERVPLKMSSRMQPMNRGSEASARGTKVHGWCPSCDVRRALKRMIDGMLDIPVGREDVRDAF